MAPRISDGRRMIVEFVLRRKGWGGRRDLNPRLSEPQSDALPAELLPPTTDNKQFTLLFARIKQGSMGQSHQFCCQLERELRLKHASDKADASVCSASPFSLTHARSTT